MTRTVDLLALVRADWRRQIGWLLGGWAVFALVLMLALAYLGCRDCPAGTVDRFTTLRVLTYCLVYGMAPWVFSVHAVHHGTGMLTALPLSRGDINRFMVLRGLVLGLACLPTWVLVLWVLPRFGMAIHPWLVVFTGLGVFAYQLFGMVTGTFVRVAVTAIFPLVIFPPNTQRLLSGPLEFAATPWAAVIMVVLVGLALPGVLARPLPSNERRPR